MVLWPVTDCWGIRYSLDSQSLTLGIRWPHSSTATAAEAGVMDNHDICVGITW